MMPRVTVFLACVFGLLANLPCWADGWTPQNAQFVEATTINDTGEVTNINYYLSPSSANVTADSYSSQNNQTWGDYVAKFKRQYVKDGNPDPISVFVDLGAHSLARANGGMMGQASATSSARATTIQATALGLATNGADVTSNVNQTASDTPPLDQDTGRYDLNATADTVIELEAHSQAVTSQTGWAQAESDASGAWRHE